MSEENKKKTESEQTEKLSSDELEKAAGGYTASKTRPDAGQTSPK